VTSEKAPTCARCLGPLHDSTATVRGDEGYPAYMLRRGKSLCLFCDRDRDEACRRAGNGHLMPTPTLEVR